MHFFQSSPPPSRPPRNPARVDTPTNVGESTPDGRSSPTSMTLSDIVLVRRHKSASAKIKQPLSKAVRPRVNSITLPPSKSPRPDTAPGSASPSRFDFTLNSSRLRPTTAPKPMSHPRPRPSTAPYPPSSYPRSRPGTPSAGPSSFRPPNIALASLLATKPPPPPPPTPPPLHQHQRAKSLHPQPPPQLRLRTSFSSPRPNSDKNTTPESNASRPRPASAYIPATTSKSNHTATNDTKAFRSPVAMPAPKHKSQPPQFSTADRTILEELKRTISAKAAQFVVKGIDHGGMAGSMGMGKRGGGRHHPFPKEEVPYPRCYEREAVDLDVWETSFCEQICDSVTWHTFEEPPTKVYVVSLRWISAAPNKGTGTWILNCARLWKRCHFVGLDIVPLHPDLQQVGSSDLAARITWVQENFLNGLPFPNEEFDFVHIKRIARGVPEDKWDSLFEEITRVMKPGGAFEMVEEDLFFPGKDPDSDESYQTDFEFQSCVNLNDEDTDNTPSNSSASECAATTPMKIAGPTISSIAGLPLVTASLSAVTLMPAHTRPHTAPGRQKFGRPEPKAPSQPRPVSRSPSLQLPGRIQPFPKLKRPAQGHGSFQLRGPSPSTASPSSPGCAHVSARPSTSSSLTMVSHPTAVTADPHSPKTLTGKPPQDSQVLLKTLPRPPSNPRDHRLLEAIYTEMHAARFINLSPLSILANTLGLYFEDVRTHLPLQFTFPPRSEPRDYLSKYSGYDSDSSDSDDARHALHNPNSPGALDPSRRNDSPWLSRLDLIEHNSPYVHLDDTCLSALTPFLKSPSGRTARGSPQSASGAKLSPLGSPNATPPNAGMTWAASRLPNRTVHLDLRTLNLHLALRTADTLACAEAMWEWVADYQAACAKNRTPERAWARSGSVDGPTAVADAIRRAINTLTRADFDALLTKFDLDMRDHIGLEPAMKERFAWSVFPSSPTAERKVFDTACGKWEQWEQEQQQQRSRQRHTDNGLTDHAGPPNGAFQVPIVAAGTARRRSSASVGPTCGKSIPDRRLSRVLRVFVAWKAT